MQSTFADTILNIAVTGPLVRLDLGTLVPQQTQDGKNGFRPNPTMQVVMPLEGFVRSLGMQEQVVKKLIADGVIKTQDPAQPAAVAAEGVATH